MPDKSYYARNDSDAVVRAYKTYMGSIAKLLGATRMVGDFVRQTFAFEKRLAEVSAQWPDLFMAGNRCLGTSDAAICVMRRSITNYRRHPFIQPHHCIGEYHAHQHWPLTAT